MWFCIKRTLGKKSEPYKVRNRCHCSIIALTDCPSILCHRMVSASWPGSSSSCWSMLGVLFLIFQHCRPAGRGQEWRRRRCGLGDDKAQDGWVSKKGEAPVFFFYFPHHFLCVVTYLLFRHACYARSETNVWVQEGGCNKKKWESGGQMSREKKNTQQCLQENVEQHESLHANFKPQQLAAIAMKHWLANELNLLVQQNRS